MKYPSYLPLLALLVAAGCDTQQAAEQKLPTEPAAASSSASAAEAAAERGLNGSRSSASSTTCAAYRERLEVHQLTLERFAGDEAATEAVATYTSLIADACN